MYFVFVCYLFDITSSILLSDRLSADGPSATGRLSTRQRQRRQLTVCLTFGRCLRRCRRFNLFLNSKNTILKHTCPIIKFG